MVFGRGQALSGKCAIPGDGHFQGVAHGAGNGQLQPWLQHAAPDFRRHTARQAPRGRTQRGRRQAGPFLPRLHHDGRGVRKGVAVREEGFHRIALQGPAPRIQHPAARIAGHRRHAQIVRAGRQHRKAKRPVGPRSHIGHMIGAPHLLPHLAHQLYVGHHRPAVGVERRARNHCAGDHPDGQRRDGRLRFQVEGNAVVAARPRPVKRHQIPGLLCHHLVCIGRQLLEAERAPGVGYAENRRRLAGRPAERLGENAGARQRLARRAVHHLAADRALRPQAAAARQQQARRLHWITSSMSACTLPCRGRSTATPRLCISVT